MAKVIIPIDEHELTQRIKDAADKGVDVALLPQQASRLLYRYLEFEKIAKAVQEAQLKGFTSIPLLVSRLIGEHLALKQVTDAGIVPTPIYEYHTDELKLWRDWADILAKGDSDEAKRAHLENDLVALSLWRTEAKRLIGVVNTTNGPPTDAELMGMLRILFDESNAPIEKEEGWFRWAQQALGLSDAYVEEQKLGVDDLRRMIRERL